MMEQGNPPPGGSATRWGPLFGARPRIWAETWEGATGWGTPVYEHVLDRAKIGVGSRVLDCGCGAGRFARGAADRGAAVAGIDAAAALIEIAAERTSEGGFRVGDLEALPCPDDTFDVVTGYAPDLNPDEGVWKHLKCVELKNLCCESLSELRVELRKAKERLRHKRDVILGCIRQPGFEV